MPGPADAPGSPGLPARLPCEPPVDYSKVCPDPCPTGAQGSPGETGVPGDKGIVEKPGDPDKRGLDRKTGPKGEVRGNSFIRRVVVSSLTKKKNIRISLTHYVIMIALS
ncbi:hypothetical protein DICVIV_14212 [Dictyocaulus viviparus]|uniref:Collagen triple helix repeat protein n=1 Tax=Dictyocaulus viviparus TaxID=29172 RepID=A0A0D8X7Y3_DICVI|nr:hypothetical protein DICVIV_14212 [Dictyocaulus viviparus]